MPMSEENRRKAAERMRAMVAARNHKTAVVERPSEIAFSIRKIREGSFSGLWELKRLDTNKILVDADLKPVVMANVLKILRAL